MISKIPRFKYNILALLNVLSGFLLTIILMKYFGSSHDADNYFTALLVIANINVLIGFFYYAFLQHYLTLKYKQPEIANDFYWLVSFISFLVACLVVFLYKVLSYSFLAVEPTIDNFVINHFMSGYIFILLVLPLFEINNFLINANGGYALPYFLNILLNIANFFAVLFFPSFGIDILIYSTLGAYLISVAIQFIIIFKKLQINRPLFHLHSYDLIRNLIRDSFIIKLSSVINGIADIIIASVFTSIGEGIYAVYSYARKFALAVFNIANGPFIKKFNTDIARYISQNDFSRIIREGYELFYHIALLFIFGEIIVYFMLSYLPELVGGKFTINDVPLIQNMFIYLAFFYGLLIIEYLLNAVMGQLHAFKYSLIINIVFIGLFASMKIAGDFFENSSYEYILLALIIAEFFNILIGIFTFKHLLQKVVK